jgi:serine/threonine protein kinase
MIGKTVGKYRIVERLGRGGMGTVYKAIDETLDREVAIKVLNADLGDTEILKRFRAEAVTLARLNHPGIATLYELYRDDNDLLMVMEFVRGETVHELSERLGALAAPQAAHLAMQVLDALAHAHRAGVVHRDLKPANLMVTEMGIVKVMDFGIARVLGTEHFTQGGYMMGTPAYMAPEQVLGGEIDGRADLYAVGVVLYRLLSGRLPFSADTAIAMVQKQVNEPPTPITQFQPNLPPWCARVLNRALAKAPADRFQTADEFRTALLSAVQPQTLGEMPTMATPTPLGIHLLGDATGTLLSSSATSATAATPQTYSQRASAAAVATPLATSVPGAVPLPPVPAVASAPSTASGKPRPAEGSTTTLVLGRKQLFGLGAAALILVLGLAAFGFYALRRSTFPQQLQIGAQPTEEAKPAADASGPNAATGAAAPSVGAGQPEAPGPPTPPTPPGAPNSPADGAAAAAAGAAAGGGLPGAKPTGRAAGAPGTLPPVPPPATPGARGARGSVPAPPGTEGTPASGTPAPAAPASTSSATPEAAAITAASPVTFNDVRVLVKSGDRTRELTGVLSLGAGQLSVLDKVGGTALVSLPYSSLTGAAYSRSKQPRWKDASGKDVEAKVDLGRLGFFRSDRNWVILFSHGEPTFIRIEDGSLPTVLPAIESHAGLKVRR